MGYNNELIINEDFDTSYNDSTQPFTGSLAGQKCARYTPFTHIYNTSSTKRIKKRGYEKYSTY